MISREISNFLRQLLDNLLPPIIRDNKIIMYPLFYIWFKGKNVTKFMEFKSVVDSLSESEYTEYYKIYEILPDRDSDLSRESIEFILDHLGSDKNEKIIDVGCGNGYVLSSINKKGYNNLVGCDIVNKLNDNSIPFVLGDILKLPFDNNEFDTVICNHTIEHIMKDQQAMNELIRISKNRVIITTPRQKYYKYTFDLHVNFYPQKYCLLKLIDLKSYKCIDIKGDWSYIGYKYASF